MCISARSCAHACTSQSMYYSIFFLITYNKQSSFEIAPDHKKDK